MQALSDLQFWGEFHWGAESSESPVTVGLLSVLRGHRASVGDADLGHRYWTLPGSAIPCKIRRRVDEHGGPPPWETALIDALVRYTSSTAVFGRVREDVISTASEWDSDRVGGKLFYKSGVRRGVRS